MSANDPSLLDELAKEIERFVFLKERSLYRLIALWVIGTHFATRVFQYFGYLNIESQAPSCGKTILLDVLQELAWKAGDQLVMPTPAVIYNTANDETLLLDEIDTWSDESEKALRAVLNVGFKNSGVVKRMMKGENGNFDHVRSYPVYGPKALAGIGRTLPEVTVTRVFTIPMVRQASNERREKLVRSKRGKLKELKSQIAGWVTQHENGVRALYDAGVFPYLECFSDRTQDVAFPLASILEALCPESPTARQDFLAALSLARNEKSEIPSIQVIRELAELSADSDGQLVGMASELCQRLKLKLPDITDADISRVLTDHGFSTRSIRLSGSDPRNRYALERRALDEIVMRLGAKPVVGSSAEALEAAK